MAARIEALPAGPGDVGEAGLAEVASLGLLLFWQNGLVRLLPQTSLGVGKLGSYPKRIRVKALFGILVISQTGQKSRPASLADWEGRTPSEGTCGERDGGVYTESYPYWRRWNS